MSRLAVERYDDFTGGLNLRADQFQLARNESPDMLNVEIDPRGGVFARGAMVRLNTTAVSGAWNPQRLWPFYGDSSVLMLSNSTKLYKSTGGDFSTVQYSAGNDVTAVSSHGACLAQWGDTLYIAIGQAGSGGYKWKTADTYATALSPSGTNPNDWQAYGAPVGGKMPSAEHLCVHANKLFVAHTREAGTVYPDRIRWSHEALPEDWQQDDFIDVKGGGLGVTGMCVVQGQLVIFKQNAIFLLVGTESDNFQLVELSNKLGCSNHHSFAVSEAGVYFWSSPEGVFYYDGTKIVDIFEPLRPIIDLKQLSTASVEPYSVSYMGRRVWIALPYDSSNTVAYPNANFVYDPTIGAAGAWTRFTTHDTRGVVGGTDWTDSSNNNLRVAAHATSAYVLKVDVYEDEADDVTGTATAFASYYRTGWVDGRTYAQKKMFRRPDIVFKQVDSSRTVNVKVYHNYEEATGNERKQFDVTLDSSGSGMLWGVGQWGVGLWGENAEGVQVLAGQNLGFARAVQLLFTGPSSNNSGWGFDSIAYKFNVRKVTG
jgi:hypothetical protein